MRAGVTSGAELVAALRAEASRRALPVEQFIRPIIGNKSPSGWLADVSRAHRPLARTIQRARELVEGRPVEPVRRYARQPGASRERVIPDPSGSIPDSVDRDPCFKCGVRGDIGCKHRGGGARHGM